MPQVGAEALGRVRLLRKELAAAADEITTAAKRIPADVVAAAAFKGATGADRAWQRIISAMLVAPLQMDRRRRFAVWRLLRPSEGIMIDSAGKTQGDEVVAASALVIGLARGHGVRQEVAWGCSFTTHALARLFERTGYRADPVQTMLQAHDALLACTAAAAKTMVKEKRWAIPAGDGAFLGTMRGLSDGDDDALCLVTCETWVAADMLWPEQVAQVAAIKHREPGRSLGDALLLPSILRPVAPRREDETGRVATLTV